MSNAFDHKKTTQQAENSEAFGSAKDRQQNLTGNSQGERIAAEAHAQAPVADPQAVDAVMRTLRELVVRHAFSFALFSLNDKLEYLFGYQSKPGEFLSGATELCQRGYVLVALAMSQDFDNWVTLELSWKGHFRPAGFSWEALDEALSLQRSDAGSDIH